MFSKRSIDLNLNRILILILSLSFVLLDNHELVFMNFYADWCGFSRSLAPEVGLIVEYNQFAKLQIVNQQ